jgi:hypothetical protein
MAKQELYPNICTFQEAEAVIGKILRLTPRLKRGETMTAPTGLAKAGRLDDVEGAVPIEAVTRLIRRKDMANEGAWMLNELELLELDMWFYPYVIIKTSGYDLQIGDKHTVIDALTYKSKRRTFTEAEWFNQGYLIRYGVAIKEQQPL